VFAFNPKMRAMLMQKRAMESALRKRSLQDVQPIVSHSSAKPTISKDHSRSDSYEPLQSPASSRPNTFNSNAIDDSKLFSSTGKQSSSSNFSAPHAPSPTEDLAEQLQRLHHFCQGQCRFIL
jgi:hypothetical protein